MAMLDGVFVDNAEIEPHRHEFIGTFRSPAPPEAAGYVMCACGHIIQTREGVFDHWQRGHFDVMQYRSLDPSEAIRRRISGPCGQTLGFQRHPFGQCAGTAGRPSSSAEPPAPVAPATVSAAERVE